MRALLPLWEEGLHVKGPAAPERSPLGREDVVAWSNVSCLVAFAEQGLYLMLVAYA